MTRLGTSNLIAYFQHRHIVKTRQANQWHNLLAYSCSKWGMAPEGGGVPYWRGWGAVQMPCSMQTSTTRCVELFRRRRWRLISAQLSNKFGYCPLYTVSIVLYVHNHNSLPLGQIRAFISHKLPHSPLDGYVAVCLVLTKDVYGIG